MIVVYRGGPWHGRRETVDAPLQPVLRVLRPGEVLERPERQVLTDFSGGISLPSTPERIDVPPLDVEYVLLDRRGDVAMYLCGDPSPEEMAAGWPLANLSPSQSKQVRSSVNQPSVGLGDRMIVNGQHHLISGIDFGDAGAPMLTLTPVHLQPDAADSKQRAWLESRQQATYEQFCSEFFRI